MAFIYPGAIDAPPGTVAQGGSQLTSPDHAQDHRTLGSAVIGIETFLGTNAGTNIFGGYLAGWQPLAINGGTLQATIAAGTFSTLKGGTLTGAMINNGTLSNGVFNNGTYGTVAITGGTETATLRILGSNAYTPAVSAIGTIDLSTGNRFLVTLGNTAGSTGLAIKNSVANQPFLIEILQGTAGNGTVNWFGSINWLNNGTSAPAQGTTASLKQTFGFITTGAGTFDGYLVGQAS